jgi:hypothetical protein
MKDFDLLLSHIDSMMSIIESSKELENFGISLPGGEYDEYFDLLYVLGKIEKELEGELELYKQRKINET